VTTPEGDAPLLARAILLRPRPILANLERARAVGVAEAVPNPWQLALGVLRLWHRVLFRGDTVGTSPGGRVHDTWRARLLEHKALRLPALLAEGAVRPLDFTGLAATPEQMFRHLLGAHHDQRQFVYDLEILAACHPGALERLHAEVLGVLAAPDAPRHRWLRDLTVFEGYHEALRDAVERALAGGPAAVMTAAEAEDPDISFRAYLRWCAAQPPTPSATLAAIAEGRFRLDGLLEPAPAPAPAAPAGGGRAADLRAADLRALPRRELAALLAAGHPVAPGALAGWLYRGVSLGLPAAFERATWKKFAKAFVRDPATGAVHGWNVRVRQDDLDGPVTPLERRGRPRTFGPFAVVPAPAGAPGVVLDYGARHGRLHPLARLRDPVVALRAGSAELLLGRSDVDAWGVRWPTPSYFTLERAARL
jgi:hypothetical protein